MNKKQQRRWSSHDHWFSRSIHTGRQILARSFTAVNHRTLLLLRKREGREEGHQSIRECLTASLIRSPPRHSGSGALYLTHELAHNYSPADPQDQVPKPVMASSPITATSHISVERSRENGYAWERRFTTTTTVTKQVCKSSKHARCGVRPYARLSLFGFCLLSRFEKVAYRYRLLPPGRFFLSSADE